MGPGVLAAEPARLDPGVDLGGRDARVPEELLDRAQVGAALEQVGGERVAQHVRRDAAGKARLAHPALEPASYVRGVKAAPALGNEHRRLVPTINEGRTGPLQIAAK